MFIAQQKLIWLLALVAVFLAYKKLQEGHFVYRSRATSYLTYGFSLLAFGTCMGLLGNVGILGQGYANSLVFFFLESVVGYVAGWGLIIWGMALWLPYVFSVSSRLDKKTKFLNLYEVIAKVSTYGGASPATFGKIANEIMEYLGYQGISLHIMNTDNRLELFSAVGLTEKSQKLIGRPRGNLYEKVYTGGEIFQADSQLKLHPEIIIETTSGPVVDAIALPVDCGAKRVGVIAFYSDQPRHYSLEELQVLELLAADLGQLFYRDGLARSLDQQKTIRDFMAVIMKTARSDDNLNTQAIRLAKLLRGFMRFETLHIYLSANGPSHLLDFNLPTGGRVAIERGHFRDSKYAPVTWVMTNKRSLSLPEHLSLLGGGFMPERESSNLYLPIVVSGQPVGVIELIVKGNHHYNLNEIITCEAIATVLAGVLLNERNTLLASEALEKIGAIKYSLETISDNQVAGNELRELARIVVEKTPATFCRVMLLNGDRTMFQTAAIYQRRDLLWDEKSIADLSLSELYAHRKVIATGRPLILSDEDKSLKMSELEASLLLPRGVSQCLIMPLIIDGKSIGLMTIGENRGVSRNRLGAAESIFATLLAITASMYLRQRNILNALELTIDSNREATKRARFYEIQSKSLGLVWGLPSQMNGPLAGILASCEYIRNAAEIRQEELNKYIGIISRNAEKIHRLSGRFAEVRKVMDKETAY
jgi:transcriptional regulator with GAF, ATPase, and Fis domain